MDLKEIIIEKFKNYSDQQLVDKANRSPDFRWDDEGYEIERRSKENGLKCEMQGDKIVILKNDIKESNMKNSIRIEMISDLADRVIEWYFKHDDSQIYKEDYSGYSEEAQDMFNDLYDDFDLIIENLNERKI